MADNTIIQKITIEGGKEIEAALKSMGKTGEDAFKKINTAAHEVKGNSGLDDLAKSTEAAGSTIGDAGAKLNSTARLMDLFGSSSKEAARDAKGLSQSAADTISGISGMGGAADQAGAAVGATDVGVIRFAQTLRLLGRAARIPELSQFARTLGIVGRAAQIAAPALFVSFAEKIAQSAAKAADTVADSAAKNKTSLATFQDFGDAFTAIGGGVDDAGKAFSSLKDQIKETAHNTESNIKNFAQLADGTKQAEQHIKDLQLQFADLDREGRFAARDFARSMDEIRHASSQAASNFADAMHSIQKERDKLNNPVQHNQANQQSLLGLSAEQVKFVTEANRRNADEQTRINTSSDQARAKAEGLAALAEREKKLNEQAAEESRKSTLAQIKLQEEYAEGVRKRREALIKLNREQDEADKKLRDAKKAQEQARIEADRNATAFEKLGIKVVEGNGKLTKVPAVMDKIAEALKAVTDEEKRAELGNELVAAGLDRKLIPALARGAKGYADLKKEGERIRPPFSKEDIKVSDDFNIAMGQVQSAIGTLRNNLGIAIAPAFTNFFKQLTEIFITLQVPMKQFGAVVNNILGPILDGLGKTLAFVIDGIGGAAEAFAKLINGVFGTHLTTVEVVAGLFAGLALIFGGLPTKITLLIAAFGNLFDKLANALGIGEFGKRVIATIATVIAAFFFLRFKILAAFLGIGTFISNIGGLLFGLIPVLVFVGIAALAFFAIWKNWDTIKGPVLKAFNAISDFAQGFWEGLKSGFNSLMTEIGTLWDRIVAPARAAFDGLVSIFDNVLVPAFDGLKKVFLSFVDFLNDTFKTKLTAGNVGIGIVIGLLILLAGAIAPVTVALVGIIAIAGFLANKWKDNQAALILLGIAVAGFLLFLAPWTVGIGLVVLAVGFLIAKWDDFKKGVAAVMKFFSDLLDETVKWFKESWLGKFIGVIDTAIGKLKEFFAVQGKATQGDIFDPLGGPRTGIVDIPNQPGLEPKLAGGGSVWGSGTSTSDSIPAWLSDGEFVTQTKAVNYYGRTFMHALNQMRIPKDMFRGFNMGGLAESMATFPGALKFASGGLARGPLHPVHIHLENGQVISGLQASDGVVKTLVRASVARQVSSAGRKPSYFGKGRV